MSSEWWKGNTEVDGDTRFRALMTLAKYIVEQSFFECIRERGYVSFSHVGDEVLKEQDDAIRQLKELVFMEMMCRAKEGDI